MFGLETLHEQRCPHVRLIQPVTQLWATQGAQPHLLHKIDALSPKAMTVQEATRWPLRHALIFPIPEGMQCVPANPTALSSHHLRKNFSS